MSSFEDVVIVLGQESALGGMGSRPRTAVRPKMTGPSNFTSPSGERFPAILNALAHFRD